MGIEVVLASMLWFGPPTLPSEASAATTVGVDWEGPADCDGRAMLVERLGELLPTLEVGERGSIGARVRLAPSLRGWAVSVEIDSELGVDRREFVAESCAVAIDASALVIAVVLDPITAAQELEHIRASEPEPEPEPEPEFEPEPTPRFTVSTDPLSEPSPRDVRSRRRDLRAGLAVFGGGGFGPLQAGSGLLGARVALLGPERQLAWRVELRGGWLPPVVHSIDELRRIRVDGWLIGARGCGVLHRGSLEFPLCGGLEAGAVRGAPLEPIANPREASQPWIAAELGPGLTWAIRPRLALGLEVAAVVPFVTAGFALDEQRVLGFSPVGVRALAGIELRLP